LLFASEHTGDVGPASELLAGSKPCPGRWPRPRWILSSLRDSPLDAAAGMLVRPSEVEASRPRATRWCTQRRWRWCARPIPAAPTTGATSPKTTSLGFFSGLPVTEDQAEAMAHRFVAPRSATPPDWW